MTTFIDKDSGAEWEQVDSLGAWVDGKVFIRPVKKPKFRVSWLTDDGVVNQGVAIEFDCSNEDQAQLIKDCVQQLMAWIMYSGSDDFKDMAHKEFDDAVKKAKTALQKGQDD